MRKGIIRLSKNKTSRKSSGQISKKKIIRKNKVSSTAKETKTFWATKQVKKTTKFKLSEKPKPKRYKKKSLKKLFG